MKKFIFITSLILFLLTANNVKADTIGEKRHFYLESSYDLFEREEIRAVLVRVTPNLYFYVDETWWNFNSQNEIQKGLSDLEEEFNNNIYSTLVSTFGPEWNPGIDKDSKITVLFHPMRKDAGGYFSTKDEYSLLQISSSNQREMIYLNIDYIESPLIKSFLAHEFVHLITFNQKENNYDVIEETWLNEARAEYVSTLLGYDDIYYKSNLERRVEIFSSNPYDSLIDWQGKKDDYGSIALFVRYLVDHYGIEILTDSLQSSKIGIDSINYALAKNGFEENFSQVFLNWIIALLINDCNYGSKYCYLDKNLRNFYVSPQINFLPFTEKSSLSVANTTKSWTGNWYKIIGGQGNLKLEFISSSGDYFSVPYIIKNKNGSYNINFLEISNTQKGEIYIEDFGKEIASLFILPVVNKQNNKSFYSFYWSVSITETKKETKIISQLLAQIELLTAQIAEIQAKINSILNGDKKNQQEQGCQNCQNNIICQKIKNNLSYGLMDNQEVYCLQKFLKLQGIEIYPEGLITGNFLSLTKQAIIRFQEKYASEVLTPWGIEKGTGYVGRTTINMVNKMLGY